MRHIAKLQRIRSSLSSDWNLDATEVDARRQQYGLNDIVGVRGNRFKELAIDTAKDPMIWFLIITSILFTLLKNYNEALILFIATIPLIVMDAFLHWRTQVSTQTLSSHLSTSAIVIRNNIQQTIPATDIVPGDLVVIQTNTWFPADGIIISSNNLQVDESALTGEALPVKKQSASSLQFTTQEPAFDSCFWGFAGTRVLTGHALLRVVYTGRETLYGEIVTSTLHVRQAHTPLQQAISRLVMILIFAATGLCIILAIVRLYQGFGLIDALLSAATLAVAALPDEYPVVFTFFLGVGVYRLAKKKALVRRAVSVENIGRVTVICSDKTGTITEGYFKLTDYLPDTAFTKDQLLYATAIASRLESGDLLDLAIFEEVKKKQILIPERGATFPFTEDRKRETSIAILDSGKWLIATKGAPETILSICSLSDTEKSHWLQRVTDLAASGYKVIATAQAIVEQPTQPDEQHLQFTFVGLVTFADPPRNEVFAAIQLCQESKLHVLMITGDHPDTARSIATKIGLGQGHPNVILGHEFQALIQQHGREYIRQIDVVARAAPSQKLDIVTLLQSLNEIVAVTGDGVNDVPALKAGDVGIAMGERGTQSAREVSDIILLDDNFNSIVQAIGEGRQLFKNLQSSFKYILMVHMPFVISAAVIPLLGFPLLYYPIHIVFIELIIHPTSMLVFQDLPTSNKLDIVSSQRTKLHFFSRFEWFWILGTGIFATLIVIGSFLFYISGGIDYARSMVLAELCFCSAGLTIGLSGFKTTISKIISTLTLFFGIFLIQVPVMSRFFSFTPLGLNDWLIVGITGFIVYKLTKIIR